MNKLKSIIIVGIISIGLVTVVVANNDNKTPEKNSIKSEKGSCTHQTSCSDQKKESCSYKTTIKNCDKSSNKTSCSKVDLNQSCSSKKNG